MNVPPSSSSDPSSPPALFRHPLSSPTTRPPADDLANSWILEFILRQPIPERLAHDIFLSLPFSSFHPHLRKTLLLRRLSSELDRQRLSESTLHSLELIEELDRLNGCPPSDRLKAAYCAAAVECTVAASRRGAGDFAEVVGRIWVGRVVDLARSEAAAGLLSKPLVEWANRMEKWLTDAEGIEDLMNRDVAAAMRPLSDYLKDAREGMGPSFLEIAAAEVLDNGLHWRGVACKEGKEEGDDGPGLTKLNRHLGNSQEQGKVLVNNGNVEKCVRFVDVPLRTLDDNQVNASRTNLEDGVVTEVSPARDGNSMNGHDSRADEVEEEGLKAGGHKTYKQGIRLNHNVDSGEVRKVKEALIKSYLERQMAVEDPLPEAQVTAAAVLASFSSCSTIHSGPVKNKESTIVQIPHVQTVAGGTSNVGSGVLEKKKCDLMAFADLFDTQPLHNKDLDGRRNVKEFNMFAESSKGTDNVARLNLKECDPTAQTSEGQEKGAEKAAAGTCLDAVLKEVPKRKRSLPQRRSPEPLSKKGKTAEEGQPPSRAAHEWQQSVELPYCVNFIGEFGDESCKIAVETLENEKKLTVVSQQSFEQSHVVPWDMGLAIGGGLVTKDLEEWFEKTSTPDAYANIANMIISVIVCLPLLRNRTLRTEEQVIVQGRLIQQQGDEIQALKAQLVTKSSQHDALQEEKTKLQEDFTVYKSVIGALKTDNKALREKLNKVAEDQEATVAVKSAAAVEAYKISLSCRKESLDGIRRAWECLASTLIQEGKITAGDLSEVNPFSCLAVDPIYKEEELDLSDDFIQQMFDILDNVNSGQPS